MALQHHILHEVRYMPGYIAGEDLRTKQFYWVKDHTDGTAILIDAGGADACMHLGVLLNEPYTGEDCVIARAGSMVPVVLGATMTKWQLGMPDVADGTTIVATDAAIATCRILYGGTDGETVMAELGVGFVDIVNVSLHNTGA